jgi:predicted flap endonuclease-1-like 5' DNA nuclease
MRVRLQFFILGLLAGWWLSRQNIDWQGVAKLVEEWATLPASEPAGIPAVKAPSAAARPAAEALDGGEPDVLTEIKGIGPTFEHALRQAGITTFAQLAALDADALAEKLDGRVTGERIRRENWIAQAQERARAAK